MSVITLPRPVDPDQIMWEELPFTRPIPIDPVRREDEVDFLSDEIIRIETSHATEILEQAKTAFKVAQTTQRMKIEKENQAKEIAAKSKRISDLERSLAKGEAEVTNLRAQLHNEQDQNVNGQAQIRVLTNRLQRKEEWIIRIQTELAGARNSVHDRDKLIALVRENKVLSDAVSEKLARTAGCACLFQTISYFLFPPYIAFTFGGSPALLQLRSKEWAKVDARQAVVRAEIKEIENRILADGFDVDLEMLEMEPEELNSGER